MELEMKKNLPESAEKAHFGECSYRDWNLAATWELTTLLLQNIETLC